MKTPRAVVSATQGAVGQPTRKIWAIGGVANRGKLTLSLHAVDAVDEVVHGSRGVRKRLLYPEEAAEMCQQIVIICRRTPP